MGANTRVGFVGVIVEVADNLNLDDGLRYAERIHARWDGVPAIASSLSRIKYR
jgi:hypothetical protein